MKEIKLRISLGNGEKFILKVNGDNLDDTIYRIRDLFKRVIKNDAGILTLKTHKDKTLLLSINGVHRVEEATTPLLEDMYTLGLY